MPYFLCDGALYTQTHRAFSFCGTIEYMAPELVKATTAGHDFVSWLSASHCLFNVDLIFY